MLSNFEHVLPHVIFESVEVLGGRCTGRFIPLNALENRVYDVELEDRTHVVIKFYRPGRWHRETIQSEHSFLATAAESEVPVVCPLSDGNGQTLFEKDGVFYAVFPKKTGRLEPELSPARLKRVGHYLARLHNVGSSFRQLERRQLTPKIFGRDSLETLLELEVIAPQMRRSFEMLVNQCCDAMEPLFSTQKFILVHGDCHVGNVLWDRDEPFFVDFDDMLYAPAVQDFWMLVGGNDEYAKKNWEDMLSAYETLRPFDFSSLQLVEALRTLRMIHFSAWIARRRTEAQFRATFPDFATERYWQEQIESLACQLESLRRS